MNKIRLGVNIDHVATIRNARGGIHPCPINAANIAEKAGCHGITAHLREDRRHIRDIDIQRLKSEISLPLNLEMAATDEMFEIAYNAEPNAVCFVPEKREEITTEGGLNIEINFKILKKYIRAFKNKKIRVSLFLEAKKNMINLAKELEADIIEFHTGKFCHLTGIEKIAEFNKIKEACEYADSLGIECHAGHGLDYITAKEIIAIKQIKELNIGHFLIGEAVYEGLDNVIKKMLNIIESN